MKSKKQRENEQKALEEKLLIEKRRIKTAKRSNTDVNPTLIK